MKWLMCCVAALFAVLVGSAEASHRQRVVQRIEFVNAGDHCAQFVRHRQRVQRVEFIERGGGGRNVQFGLINLNR